MNNPNVVVVTGASAGVGRAVALAYARRNAAVGLIARGREALEATAAEVEAAGGKALPVSADVASFEQIQDAARRIESGLGPVDVWVNNAMATVFGPVRDMSAKEFHRVTDVTYHGFVHGTMAALDLMRPRGRGTIVQVGSALAYRGIPLQSAYCGAKHAMKGFTESVITELRDEDLPIRICMVHLPAVNTPQFDMSRSKLDQCPQPVPPIYQPDLAARAIVHAAESGRRETFVGAPAVATVWGNRIAPGLVDRHLGRTGRDSQTTDRRCGPRDGNLFEPLPGDHGTYGRFGQRSHESSPQMWATTHRRSLAIGALAAAGLARLVGSRVSRRRR